MDEAETLKEKKSSKGENVNKKGDLIKKEDEEKEMESDERKNENNERKCSEWEKYGSKEVREKEKTPKEHKERHSSNRESHHKHKESSRKENDNKGEEPSKTPKEHKERHSSNRESHHKHKESSRNENENKVEEPSKTLKEHKERDNSNSEVDQIHRPSIQKNEDKEIEISITQAENNDREDSQETAYLNIPKNVEEEQSTERICDPQDNNVLPLNDYSEIHIRRSFPKAVKCFSSLIINKFLESIKTLKEKKRTFLPKKKIKSPFLRSLKKMENPFLQNIPPPQYNPHWRHPRPPSGVNPEYSPNVLNAEPAWSRIQQYLQELEQLNQPNDQSFNATPPTSDMISFESYDNREEILEKIRELLPGTLSNGPDSLVLRNCIFYLQIFYDVYQQSLARRGNEPIDRVISRPSPQNNRKTNPEDFSLGELQTLLNILITYENIRKLGNSTRKFYKRNSNDQN